MDDQVVNTLDSWRKAKDDYMLNSRSSPLYGRPDFGGLTYYPENPELRLTARADRAPEAEPVLLATSSGEERMYITYGTAHFKLGGVPQSLSLYAPPDQPDGPRLFVPFRDATSGSESYGAGRYLELIIDEQADSGLIIDFNYAYHPYCAYADGYSCPFPPPGNWLTEPVRAGERLPEGA